MNIESLNRRNSASIGSLLVCFPEEDRARIRQTIQDELDAPNLKVFSRKYSFDELTKYFSESEASKIRQYLNSRGLNLTPVKILGQKTVLFSLK